MPRSYRQKHLHGALWKKPDVRLFSVGTVIALISGLVNKIVIPGSRLDPLSSSLEDYLYPRAYLGYKFESKLGDLTKKGMSNEQQNSLRDRCFNFTHALIKQLRQRLPENIDLLRKIALLRPSNALNPIKDSIVPLLEGMGVAPDDIDEIARQWSNLPFIRWQQTSTPVALPS